MILRQWIITRVTQVRGREALVKLGNNLLTTRDPL